MFKLICPECNAENPLGAEKCKDCGTILEGAIPEDSNQEKGSDLEKEDVNLSDLLHLLKHDEDLNQFNEKSEKDSVSDSEQADIESLSEQVEEEPEVPEWLNRIRQRAQAEPDSVGEVTQKIFAARQSLEDAENERQQQLESLLQKIHDEDEGTAPSEDPERIAEPDEDVAPDTIRGDWLRRIRKKHRPAEAESADEILSEREGDSLLHWLVALENGEQPLEELEEEEFSKQSTHGEITQEIKYIVNPEDDTKKFILNDVKGTQLEAMVLAISQEDQARVEQLMAALRAEKSARQVSTRSGPAFNRGLRLIIALVLIAILSLALFVARSDARLYGRLRPQAQSVGEWVHNLNDNSSILLVMDYSAAFSGEMELISTPILKEIFKTGAKVTTLSSVPAGRLLFDRLIEVGSLESRQTVADLGYFPIGSFGAYGLANQITQARNQPEFAINLSVEPFDNILIIGDDYEGVMAWIEQIHSLNPEMPILLLLSDQAGPLLQPYWESGQVQGMISGISDSVNLGVESNESPNRWLAYQVGTVLMILMLLIGMSLPGSRNSAVTKGDEQ